MVRVLIIDDEEPLREAIGILGDWEGLGVEEVLEATDGRAGLEALRRHPVDIALVDMKMPELGGAEFLQIAEQEFPELLTIVISGYNDFEYTRQAIRSKVVDYLLKPVNGADLNAALRKAVDILTAKRRSQSESISRGITLNMSLPKLKEKLYLSIIEGTFKAQHNEALLPLIGAKEPGTRFGAGLVRILNHDSIAGKRFNGDRDLLHFAVTNVMNNISDGRIQAFSFVHPKSDREYAVIFSVGGSAGADAGFHLQQVMKKTAGALKELLGAAAAGGIGRPCGHVLELARSYDEAKAALSGIDLLKLSGAPRIAEEVVRRTSPDSPSLTGRMPLIRSALENGGLSQAKSVMSELIRKWRESDAFTLGEADRILREFMILLSDIAVELGVPAEFTGRVAEQGLSALGIQGDYPVFSQYEALLYDILAAFDAEIGRNSAGGGGPGVLENIKAYVDNRYFEDIKISMFTDKYFLSREYLMKLFKARYGYGIHEYVQKVRMGKARELLADPELKIQEISEMLGYKDKNYFSKAFRNYYECSPSEYRSMHHHIAK